MTKLDALLGGEGSDRDALWQVKYLTNQTTAARQRPNPTDNLRTSQQHYTEGLKGTTLLEEVTFLFTDRF